MGPMMKFYKQRNNLQVTKSRKIFNQLRSMPKLSTEENTCLYYTKYARSRTMADCDNIQALIHDLFLRSLTIFSHKPKLLFCLSECCSLDLPSWLLASAQLFLQPQLIPHSEQSLSIIILSLRQEDVRPRLHKTR
jgi:hypothetical protein